jgi:molybdenum cofactor cytidylyltransferase
MVGVIVLAAGTSSRYGANKLLLPFGAGSVISTVISTVARSAASPIVLVTGHQAEQVQAAVEPLGRPVIFAHNPEYNSGEMLSSIKVGLRQTMSASPAPQAVMIALGDQPLLRLDVIERMIVAFAQNCGDLITPRYGLHGQRGHPVLIGRAWWDAVLALPPESNVRELLRANCTSVTHLVVNNDSILGDVDTPEAYHEALARLAAQSAL